MTFALHDERASVSADIGKTPELGLFIRNENEWLVETALQKSEWKDVTRSLYPGRVAGPLPAPREHGVLLELVVSGMRVDYGRKSRRTRDVRVYLNRWHFFCSSRRTGPRWFGFYLLAGHE